MTNTLLRCSTWFVALGLLHFLLPFYWQRKGEASAQNCSSSTTLCTSLLTVLFLQRGCLEMYRKFYSSKVNNNNANDPDKNSIWKGRSAVYIRFALSLIVVIWCLFAVLENSVQTLIFFFSSSSAGSTSIHPNDEQEHFYQTTVGGKTQHNNDNNHNHEEDEDAILRKIYNPHHSMVDADRSSYDTLAKSRRNLENNENAFSPGASVPHYHRLLQDDHHPERQQQQNQQNNDKNVYDDQIVVQEDVAMQELLCPLRTSLLSSVFLSWLIHNGAIMYIFFSNIQSVRKHNKLIINHKKNLAETPDAKGDSKNDCSETTTTTTSSVTISSIDDEEMVMANAGTPEVTTCWALSSDPLVELQMSTSIAIVTFLINWSCQSWSSNSFLPFHSSHHHDDIHFEEMSHHATLALNEKINEVLNSYHTFATGLCILYFEFYFHCLPALKTLTLSLTKREVNFVDSLKKKMVEELENSKKDGKEVIVNEKIIKKIINAKKTHEGKLKICFVHAEESSESILEVEKLLKEVMTKNPYLNRVFDI